MSGAQESVVKQVESLCDQLKEFMKEQRSAKGGPSDEELVAEGFELWNNIVHLNCSEDLKSAFSLFIFFTFHLIFFSFSSSCENTSQG